MKEQKAFFIHHKLLKASLVTNLLLNQKRWVFFYIISINMAALRRFIASEQNKKLSDGSVGLQSNCAQIIIMTFFFFFALPQVWPGDLIIFQVKKCIQSCKCAVCLYLVRYIGRLLGWINKHCMDLDFWSLNTGINETATRCPCFSARCVKRHKFTKELCSLSMMTGVCRTDMPLKHFPSCHRLINHSKLLPSGCHTSYCHFSPGAAPCYHFMYFFLYNGA